MFILRRDDTVVVNGHRGRWNAVCELCGMEFCPRDYGPKYGVGGEDVALIAMLREHLDLEHKKL